MGQKPKIKDKSKKKGRPALFNSRTIQRPSFSRPQLLAFALVFAAIGGYILLQSRAASSTANIFVSPNGSDVGANCKRFATAQTNPDAGGTSLCASFNKAVQLAQRGDTVEVENGTYAPQHLTSVPAGSSGMVTFVPASGASVTIGNGGSNNCAGANTTFYTLCVEGGSYIEFDNMTIPNSDAIRVINTNPGTAGSTDVTFRNMTAGTWRLEGQVANVSFIGGSYGNVVDSQPQIKKYNGNGDPDTSRPYNTVIDGVTFHDFHRSNTSIHTECLQLIASNKTLIQNSTFYNCDGTGDLGITDGPHDDLTIQNNFIGGGGDTGYGAQITMFNRNFVFQYNSSSQAIFFSDSQNYGPYTFRGNYIPSNPSFCNALATYSHNVINGGSTCSGDPGGSTNVSVSSLDFVDSANHNLHLAAGANAIDQGDPASFPAKDIDGDTRPLGAGPDAGADEFQSGPPDTTAPTVSLTAPTSGATVSGNVTINANASDNVGVAGVQFKVDGNNIGSEDTSAPYSVSWNSVLVANGSHTLTAVARDGAGNTTTSSAVTVTVSNAPDTTAPIVSLTAPANGATVFGQSVILAATASDNVVVVGVQFKVDGVNIGSEDTTSPYGVNWDTTGVSNGTHTLSAVARDGAGNTNTSSVTVTVNNPSLILGSLNLQPASDYNPAGIAQAFSYVASATGQTNQLGVYIDTGNTAPTIVAGLYSNNAGNPNNLLASGSAAISGTGWVNINLNQPVSLTSGQAYWIAILAPSGQLRYLDTSGGAASPSSSSSSLSVLPATWATGTVYSAGPASAYAVLSGGASCPQGDLNGDCQITVTDLSILLSHYGQPATFAQGDINSDGTCNVLDLSILLSHFGS